jgi:hypothetical protein
MPFRNQAHPFQRLEMFDKFAFVAARLRGMVTAVGTARPF